MTGKLRVLSGKEVVKLFEKHGAVVKRTTGSHVRLQWSDDGNTLHITVPLHKELKKGMVRSIAKNFEYCFGREAAKKEFYS